MSALAACDAAGVVSFVEGSVCPDGLLTVYHALNMEIARDLGEVVFRHGWQPGVLLVPGIPEAETKEGALDALLAFRDWLELRADEGLVH